MGRCWAYETGLCVDQDLPNQLPQSDYIEYFGPDFTLHPQVTRKLHSLLLGDKDRRILLFLGDKGRRILLSLREKG